MTCVLCVGTAAIESTQRHIVSLVASAPPANALEGDMPQRNEDASRNYVLVHTIAHHAQDTVLPDKFIYYNVLLCITYSSETLC